MSKQLHRQCCQPACCKAAPFALQEVHTYALWQGEAATICAEALPQWLQCKSGSVFSSVRLCECFTDIPVAPTPACVSAVHARAQSASRRRRIARGSGHREMDVTGMLGTFTQMRARMNQLSKMIKMGGAQGAHSPHQTLTIPSPDPAARLPECQAVHVGMGSAQGARPAPHSFL